MKTQIISRRRLLATAPAITLSLIALAFSAVGMTQLRVSVLTASRASAFASGSATTTAIAQATVAIPNTLYRAGGGTFPFANPFADKGRIETLWTRTDLPVKQKKVGRTWLWGPGPNTPGLVERYDDDPSGQAQRLVQYFDKSRMEINNPAGNWNSDFYVTNGRLAAELIEGRIQVGDSEFVPNRAACIPVTGDPDDTSAPTYATFQSMGKQAGSSPAPNLTGRPVIQTLNRQGVVGEDSSLARIAGGKIVEYASETGHNIPEVFWDFLNASGPVYPIIFPENARSENDMRLAEERLTGPCYYASGYPITEPYWTSATIRGVRTEVMLQAYERRVLTYVPTNPQSFKVEMGNIGQHYFDWRYRNDGLCPGDLPGTPTPPAPAPTSTIPAITPVIVPSPAPPMPTGSVTPPTFAPVPIPTGTITPLPTFTP